MIANTTKIIRNKGQVKKIEKEENTDPEKIITPGIFVNKVTVVSDPIIESIAIDNGETYP